MNMKNVIESWIDENLTDIRVFEGYPDPTDKQLSDFIHYMMDQDTDFLLEALTIQGEMDKYESLCLAHAERPSLKTSNSLSKYIARCLKAHAAYLLDKHGDYFSGALRNYGYQYATAQWQDFMTEKQPF